MSIGLIIRDATDTPRTVTAWLVRNGSNTQKTVEAAYERATGNSSELFYNPSGSVTLAVTTDKDTVSGFSRGSGTATTGSVTATASSGTAPYTIAWTLTTSTGLPSPPNATHPSAATTAFVQGGMDVDTGYSSEWLGTATDANGNTATASVTAVFSDIS